MVPELWERVFSFLLGDTLFVKHVDLGGACSFLSTETRKSWLSVEEPCVRTSHAVYRQIANVRVEEGLLKRFMYSQARRFLKKEERRLATIRERVCSDVIETFKKLSNLPSLSTGSRTDSPIFRSRGVENDFGLPDSPDR